jgi:hypothetical protein
MKNYFQSDERTSAGLAPSEMPRLSLKAAEHELITFQRRYAGIHLAKAQAIIEQAISEIRTQRLGVEAAERTDASGS